MRDSNVTSRLKRRVQHTQRKKRKIRLTIKIGSKSKKLRTAAEKIPKNNSSPADSNKPSLTKNEGGDQKPHQ
jgi:hypothetical protein